MKNLDECIGQDGKMNFRATGMNTSMEFYLDWPTFDTSDAVTGTALLILYVLNKISATSAEGLNILRLEGLREKLKGYVTKESATKQVAALQILCGNKDKALKERLERGGARGFTTFMSYFMLDALAKTGSRDALNIAKTYYGGMLDRGATTFWEDFDVEWLEGSGRIDEEPKAGEKDLHGDFGGYCYKGLRHSLCHGWSSGVAAYAYERLLGLEILEAGYRKIRISPDLNGLKKIEAVIPTPHGDIEVHCDEKGVKAKFPEKINLLS